MKLQSMDNIKSGKVIKSCLPFPAGILGLSGGSGTVQASPLWVMCACTLDLPSNTQTYCVPNGNGGSALTRSSN